jgi:hypothetical protein
MREPGLNGTSPSSAAQFLDFVESKVGRLSDAELAKLQVLVRKYLRRKG